MAKAFAILLMVLGVWAALEIQDKGMDRAFGGILASGDEAPAAPSAQERAAEAFRGAYDKAEERVDRQLAQPGAQE